MEVEAPQPPWEGYLDWRNRPAVVGRHGGMLAASFVLGAEILENLAYLANASNLVMYLTKQMHLTPSRSANDVTNFMGTAFLLSLLGGFLSDAAFTSFYVFLFSAAAEFLGLIILTIQARSPSLMPPPCTTTAAATSTGHCQAVGGSKVVLLFTGLYLVALGVGGIKGSLPAHGAEQFDAATPHSRQRRSTFFSYFVFCLSAGALVAVTLVVWLEDNKGWEWGFGVSTTAVVLSVLVFLAGTRFYRNKIPSGSPLTTIFKVLLAAALSGSSSNAIVNLSTSPNNLVISTEKGQTEQEDINTGHDESSQSLTESLKCLNQTEVNKPVHKDETSQNLTESQKSLNRAIVNKTVHEDKSLQTLTESLKWLNRAAFSKPIHKALECSNQQVEEVKIVLKILPIFGCTIMLNCCLAQLSTFSVQQAATMNTKLGTLKVPPASLPVFPIVFIMILAPIYDHVIIPFMRKVTKSEMGINHLQRIGIGLVLSVAAMATAALVEIKRKRAVTSSGSLESQETLPITFLWIALQYLFLGSADLFTLAGLLEFFFTETPASMRSLATSLSWASLALGYYLSSAIVSIVNRITEGSGNEPWLAGGSLNRYKLERFYWLMCALSAVNFLHYIFWANRYKYRSSTRSVHG